MSVSMTDELPVDVLARLRVLAGREAAELGDSAVDEEHLLLAVTRDELGCVDALGTIGVGRRQLRDFVMFICGVNESRAAQDQSRPYQRTRKREPVDALPPVTTWTPEATDVVRRATAEAARDDRPVGPAHLLIACGAPLAGFGPTANEMRRAFGLTVPVAPGRVAHRLPVPRRAGPLVLGGGGERVAAAVRARLATTPPSVVYIGAAYPLRPGLGRWADDWTAAGQLVVDSGLYTRTGMSAGAAPTPALPGPVTRRIACVAAAAVLVALGAWALVTRAGLAADDDPGIPTVEVLVGALFFGWPHAFAAAAAVVATARTAVGADAPARLLAFATSGRRGRRDEWGAAMRAELASITASPRERLRFAAGCALTALRRGWGRSPWIVAAACAVLFAALTVATSRASPDGSRTGSLWAVIYGPPQITLLLVGLVAAWTGRSMRTGLEHAVAALTGILLGVLAAAIPEGALWAREAGLFLLDGDAPSTPLTATGGALDALKATTLIWGLPHWLPWPVLGAAAGARLRHRATPVPHPAG